MKITEHIPPVVASVGSGPEAKIPSRSPTPPPPQETTTKETEIADRPAVQEAVAVLNKQLELEQRSIRFRIEEETDELIVTVLDKDTGEVVRQIPSEATVRLAAHLDNLNGALVSSYG